MLVATSTALSISISPNRSIEFDEEQRMTNITRSERNYRAPG